MKDALSDRSLHKAVRLPCNVSVGPTASRLASVNMSADTSGTRDISASEVTTYLLPRVPKNVQLFIF